MNKADFSKVSKDVLVYDIFNTLEAIKQTRGDSDLALASVELSYDTLDTTAYETLERALIELTGILGYTSELDREKQVRSRGDLKEGDMVKVRTGLLCDGEYGGDSFVSEMVKYRGEMHRISRVTPLEINLVDTAGWNFTPEMLTKVEED